MPGGRLILDSRTDLKNIAKIALAPNETDPYDAVLDPHAGRATHPASDIMDVARLTHCRRSSAAFLVLSATARQGNLR